MIAFVEASTLNLIGISKEKLIINYRKNTANVFTELNFPQIKNKGTAFYHKTCKAFDSCNCKFSSQEKQILKSNYKQSSYCPMFLISRTQDGKRNLKTLA